MKLIDTIKTKSRVLAAPLTGYPTVEYIGATVEDGVKSAEIQTRALRAYYKDTQPDVLYPFMDLSVEAEALGLPVRFKEGDGPDVTEHPLGSVEDLEQFSIPKVPEAGRYSVYIDTIRRLKAETDALVGGYVASPFSLAGLMMSAEKLAMNTMLEPDFCHATLQFTTKVTLSYAKAQQDAGADFIVLLEPTASLLSPELYEQFVGFYVQQITEALEVPVVLHVCGQTTNLIPSFVKNDVQGLSLDSDVHLSEVYDKIPEDVVVIGNISPVDVMFNQGAEGVYNSTKEMVEELGTRKNYVASTGCDVPPGTPRENLSAFVRAVRDFNRGD